MRILINARFLIPGNVEGIGLYTYEIVRRWVRNHPNHKFILCLDRNCKPLITGPNVEYVMLKPPARHPILFFWWFEVAIPRVYKQKKCDVFFSPDGFLSLSASISKSLLTIHDLAYLHFPDHVGKIMLWYYQWFVPKFVSKATHIITVSDASRKDIIGHFPGSSRKTTTIHNGVRDDLKPLSDEDVKHAQMRFTNGAPYFLVLGAIQPRKNLLGALRAYSIFRSQSALNVRLLIVGRQAWKSRDVMKEIAQHPYQEDIHLLGYIEEPELKELLGASAGLVYVSFLEGFGFPIVEAMASGVPVITSDRSSMKEIAADSALLVPPDDPGKIAEAMSLIVSDEHLATQLVEKGLKRAQAFNWDQAAEKSFAVLTQL